MVVCVCLCPRRSAISICEYFRAHALYAYAMMGTDLSIQKARFVLAKLRKRRSRKSNGPSCSRCATGNSSARQRIYRNVHFNQPTGSYSGMLDQMVQDGVISTRGLKPDATHFCELIFDVNSAYFYNYSGYEFATKFYADAYQAAVKIVGGEQYK